MIEMTKGYKIGDELIYYRRMGQIKKMKAPCLVKLVEINHGVIGTNHKIIETENNVQWFSHEINLYRPDQISLAKSKYYNDLLKADNSLPKKVRKEMKKFFKIYPEYLI